MKRLPEVMDAKVLESCIYVKMEYTGDVLSKNNSKLRSGSFKHSTKKWMEQLSYAVYYMAKEVEILAPLRVEIAGHFKDSRYPDLANLHEVIGDGIKRGLGVDDKYYMFEDMFVTTSALLPAIEIWIRWNNDGTKY